MVERKPSSCGWYERGTKPGNPGMAIDERGCFTTECIRKVFGSFTYLTHIKDTIMIRNIAYFEITPELIKDALHLPANCDIIDVVWISESNHVKILIESEDLPAKSPGQQIPKVFPLIHVDNNSQGDRIYQWEWKNE